MKIWRRNVRGKRPALPFRPSVLTCQRRQLLSLLRRRHSMMWPGCTWLSKTKAQSVLSLNHICPPTDFYLPTLSHSPPSTHDKTYKQKHLDEAVEQYHAEDLPRSAKLYRIFWAWYRKHNGRNRAQPPKPSATAPPRAILQSCSARRRARHSTHSRAGSRIRQMANAHRERDRRPYEPSRKRGPWKT